MDEYGKVIRDRIPEIIRTSGRECEVEVLSADDFLAGLNAKLQEELDEYMESGDIAELADLVEVVHAIVQHRGTSLAEFQRIQEAKRHERGGFERRLWLVKVEDKTVSDGPRT